MPAHKKRFIDLTRRQKTRKKTRKISSHSHKLKDCRKTSINLLKKKGKSAGRASHHQASPRPLSCSHTPLDNVDDREELTNTGYNNNKEQNVFETDMKSDLETNRRLKRFVTLNEAGSKGANAKNSSTETTSKNKGSRDKDQALVIYKREDISTYPELLNHYASLLEYSDAASRTFDQVIDQDWTFQFDDLGNGGYYIDGDHNTIWLDHSGLNADAIAASDYFYAACMMNMLRGLRDAWQESRWSGAQKTYHPESLVMLEKMRAADSDIVAVIFAKELEDKGHSQFIRHILASEDAFLARYFNSDDFLVKVQAASAFRSWFLEPKRVDTTDHETLCYLDTILEDSGHANPFGRNRLTPIEVVRMGCLPDGTSYLAGYGEAVLRDPVFSGLSDPINQAHYYHLVRDMEAFYVNGVPFRSSRLAAKIFPEETVTQE